MSNSFETEWLPIKLLSGFSCTGVEITHWKMTYAQEGNLIKFKFKDGSESCWYLQPPYDSVLELDEGINFYD